MENKIVIQKRDQTMKNAGLRGLGGRKTAERLAGEGNGLWNTQKTFALMVAMLGKHDAFKLGVKALGVTVATVAIYKYSVKNPEGPAYPDQAERETLSIAGKALRRAESRHEAFRLFSS